MMINSLAHVSDRELIDATIRAAADERKATVDLLGLLGEVDARRLYLSEGYSSLFTYCTGQLRFSEHEAYHRIEAARAVRAFPSLLERLREGALTLTSITLLRPHLRPDCADTLIAAALNKSRRDVERQVATLAPKPDAEPLVRRLPPGAVADPQAPRPDDRATDAPAAVRREVWTRDGGRCAFSGRRGRCGETGGLEFHHVHAFALGGETTAANIELRCRAHNQYEGVLLFGSRSEGATLPAPTRPGPS